MRFLQQNKINLLFDTNEIRVEGEHFKLPSDNLGEEICAEMGKIPKLQETIRNIDVEIPGIKDHQSS